MIPTMLLAGLAFGRWWKVAIPLGGLAWAVLLVATEVGSGPGFFAGAALLGAANVAVGAAVYQAVGFAIRAVKARRPSDG
jgi:hypothetical protein